MATRKYPPATGSPAGNRGRRPAGGPGGRSSTVTNAAPPARPVGKIRRSQVISTYGIGAIVDLEDGSVMPMGLEDWEQQARGGRPSSLMIYEARLQAQLGVSHFRLPPIAQEIEGQRDFVDARYTVPAVRFPLWHECPRCHRLGVEGDPFQIADNGNRLRCMGCKVDANPVRFIVACSAGHVSDFPWEWWAHRNLPSGKCPKNPVLELKSRGESAALADLYVRCKSCKAVSSLGNAFGKDTLKGRKCFGSRPWLVDHQECNDHQPRVLQRGASNIHFPVIASALSIPPVSEPLSQILDEHWELIRHIPIEALPQSLQGIAGVNGVPVESLVAAYERRAAIESGTVLRTDAASRTEEYLALSETREDEAIAGIVSQFLNHAHPAPSALTRWFDLIGAVSRLREVRAMAGFSRIEPFTTGAEGISKAISEGHVAALSKTPLGWLPAAEIRGEGIFLRFRTEAIEHWIESNPGVAERASILDARAEQWALDRGKLRDYRITPRLLLVHSFSHALIRQLSIDCGYSSSALRERLYIADPASGQTAMNGVLIYTGSPDSEGSLGGLVRLADPALITDAVTRTLDSIDWCGSDPVCLETDPKQSGERISGAACHCCLLLPETACEKFNRELDRTLLIGDSANTWRGFFDRKSEQQKV